MNNDFQKYSLCITEQREDKNGRYYIFLRRIADLENGKLNNVIIDSKKPPCFENRSILPIHDTKQTTAGEAAVWHWTAISNENDPERDYIKDLDKQQDSPVLIVPLRTSVSELIDQIKNKGVSLKYRCDVLFVYDIKNNYYLGLFCKAEQLKEKNDGKFVLDDHVYSLAYYEIAAGDLIKTKVNQYFLKEYPFKAKKKKIVLFEKEKNTIKKIFLDYLSWQKFNRYNNRYNKGTKKDWKNCKELLTNISTDQSFINAVEKGVQCSSEKAKRLIDNFVNETDLFIDQKEIDLDLITSIVMKNNDLKKQIEVDVEKKWQENNQNKISQAENKVKSIYDAIESGQEKLKNIEKQKTAISDEISSGQGQIAELKKQKQLLNGEIEAQKNAINTLLEKKTAADISNAAQSISETQHKNKVIIKQINELQKQINSIKMTAEKKQSELENKVSQLTDCLKERDVQKNWTFSKYPIYGKAKSRKVDSPSKYLDEEIKVIIKNLSCLVGSEKLRQLLSSFLYSAYINNFPILLLGPCGLEIADIFSLSIYNKEAGLLTLGNRYSPEMIDAVNKDLRDIIIVQNLFQQGWSDLIPQACLKIKQQVFFTHPYVEDLLVEPKGLYNYCFPLMTEFFVDGEFDSESLISGKRDKNFEKFELKSKKTSIFYIKEFQKFKFNPFMMNRMEIIFNDAKNIANQCFGKTNNKEFEILFGILPFSILFGRNEILDSVDDKDKDVKEIIERYREE